MEKAKNGKTASRRMHKNRFWQRGEALTEQDVALLKPVAQQALKLGR